MIAVQAADREAERSLAVADPTEGAAPVEMERNP